MAEQKDPSEKVKDALYTLSIGLGVGWLAGLSVSPVATILISGLLGIAIAIVGIISISLTYRDDKGETIRSVGLEAAQEISIGLLALIVFGIAAGATLGIYTRTHNFLGVDDESALNRLGQELNELHGHYDNKKWTELGIDKKVVAQRILDKYYPKGDVIKKYSDTASGENKRPDTTQGGLYLSKSSLSSKCKLLLLRENLKEEIPKSFLYFLEDHLKYMTEDQSRSLVDDICKLVNNNVTSQ